MTSGGRKAHTAKERALKARRAGRDAVASTPRALAIAERKAEAEAERQAEAEDKNITEYELFNGVNPYEYTTHDAMLDRIENLVERARYAEKFQYRPDLLDLVEHSPDYLSADDVGLWRVTANSYPNVAVEKKLPPSGEKSRRYTHLTGEDVAVRAYILRKALTKILTLVHAPEAMIEDVALFLTDFVISGGSDPAANLQRKIILDPSCLDNISALADDEDTDAHRTTIHDWLKNDVIRRP